MSALDDVVDAAESCDWVMPEQHAAALAELALLRRCRDVVAAWYAVGPCPDHAGACSWWCGACIKQDEANSALAQVACTLTKEPPGEE